MFGTSQFNEFLITLWGDSPPDGFLTIGLFKNKKPRGYHFLKPNDTIRIRNIVSSNKDNFDIYYEIGLQKELITNQIKRGLETGVCAIPGLWVDIDIQSGEHAKKERLPPDLGSAKELLKKFPLQPSMIVFSGGGIHAYWLFKEALTVRNSDDRNQVIKLSKRFHKTIVQYGKEDDYHIDNTSSLNHLFRLPGTLNHKPTPEKPPVQTWIMENNDNRYNPHDFDQFLLDDSYSGQSPEHKSMLPNFSTVPQSNTKKVLNNEKLEELVQKCSFLKHCKDDSRTLSEDEWHKMVCLLAHEYGGHELIHELSKDYPSYDPKETDDKIEAAIKNSPAPIRCDTLKGLWDCGRDCGVTSPIHLLKDIVKEMSSKTVGQQKQIQRPIDDDSDDFTELNVLKDRVPDRPFPWESLPPDLRYCLQDLAQDMAVSAEMCGVIALGVLSAAIGNAVKYVEAKKGFKTTVSLWLSVIADSGEKKTPILNRLMKPIFDLQHNAITSFQQQQQVAQQTVSSQQVQANQQPPSIYTTDPTLEGLIELLNLNTRGIMLFQDEISGFLLSFDKYRAGKGGDREQYLALWNSNPVKVDRVTKHLYIHRPFLSLLGGMQPKKAVSVFGDKSFDDGLISRFLFYNHKSVYFELTNHCWSSLNEKLWNDLVTNLYKLPASGLGLQLDDSAWEYYRNYSNSLERLRNHSPDRFKVFIPKAKEYILRLSGLLHVVDASISKNNLVNTISIETVKCASDIANFFLCHARKMIESYVPKKPPLTQDQKYIIKSIIKIHQKHNSLIVPVTDIHTCFNGIVTTEAQIKSDKRFGIYVRKVLNDLSIDFKSNRKKVGWIKKLVSCLEFDNASINKLMTKDLDN